MRAGLKTHKTVEAARVQFGRDSGSGTRGTERITQPNARFFLESGLPITDMSYHVSPTPNKLDEILELSNKVDKFSFLIDSPELVEKIFQWAVGKDIAKKLGCWVQS